MALLKGLIQFSGRLGGLLSYYNRRIKAYFMATNVGASKELIMNNPALTHKRENMREFKACSMWTSLLRKSLACITHLFSGYYFSDIMSLSKRIQNRDDVNLKGFCWWGLSWSIWFIPKPRIAINLPLMDWKQRTVIRTSDWMSAVFFLLF